MIEAIVDANVIKAYYHQINDLSREITLDPAHFIEADQVRLIIDIDGHIKQEWDNVVGGEWLSGWYNANLISDKIQQIIITDDCRPLKQRLVKQCGFPNSKDIWYIKTAKSNADTDNVNIIVSEDMDFFDPTKKKTLSGSKRLAQLRKNNNPVQKEIRGEGFSILCIQQADELLT